MTTEAEIKQEAYFEERDAARPRCIVCDKTSRETDIQECAECGNRLCCDCASELQWELRACTGECAVAIVRRMAAELNRLQAGPRLTPRVAADPAELREFAGRAA